MVLWLAVWIWAGIAPVAEANTLCRRVLSALEHSGGIQAPNAPEIIVETTIGYALTRPQNPNAQGYRALAVPTKGKAVHYPEVPDPRAKSSSIWLLEAPDTNDQNVWAQLSPEQRKEVARRFEQEFAQAAFGKSIIQRYIRDGTYDRVEIEYNKLGPAENDSHRTPEEVLMGSLGTIAFSDLLFLKAAVTKQQDVGMCPHQACAQAGLYYRLGALPGSVAIRFGRKGNGAFYHVYGGVELTAGDFYPIDGSPDWRVSEGLRAKRDENDHDALKKWTARFGLESGIDNSFLTPKPFPYSLFKDGLPKPVVKDLEKEEDLRRAALVPSISH